MQTETRVGVSVDVIMFFSSESLYTSSGKSLRAAGSLLFNFDSRSSMWALRLHFRWKSGVMFSLVSAFLILSSLSHQEGKDKSFLLDKLQKLQKSNEYAQKHPNKVCLEVLMLITEGLPSDVYMFLIAMAQALLAQQTFEEEEEEERSSTDGADNRAPSALIQAMLARQRAEDEESVPDTHPSSSSAIVQAMLARQATLSRERDGKYSAAGFPGDTSSAVAQAMRARQTAEDDLSSDVMPQVMQARRLAEESLQNSAPAEPSALIQAMLARQQAQDEYDDGYWT